MVCPPLFIRNFTIFVEFFTNIWYLYGKNVHMKVTYQSPTHTLQRSLRISLLRGNSLIYYLWSAYWSGPWCTVPIGCKKIWKPHDTLPVCIITPFKIKQTISLWVRVVGGTMCEWDRWGKHMVNCSLIYFSLHPFPLEITSGQIHSSKVRLACS